jgi:CMP-N-acetylneuraminic acid synthetase
LNVGIVYARGRGSSLKKKNIYPLNGKPMLGHFVKEMLRADCLDQIAVWTECTEVADVARESGAVVLSRPREMVHYESGFSNPKQWGKFVTDQLEKVFGRFDYSINLNCNYVLFRAKTLDAMMARMLEDEKLGFIYAVSPVSGNIYLENHITHNPMPLFLDIPNMVRKMNISISDVHSGKTGVADHEVSWEEGRDVQHFNDIKFAEYILKKRKIYH